MRAPTPTDTSGRTAASSSASSWTTVPLAPLYWGRLRRRRSERVGFTAHGYDSPASKAAATSSSDCAVTVFGAATPSSAASW